MKAFFFHGVKLTGNPTSKETGILRGRGARAGPEEFMVHRWFSSSLFVPASVNSQRRQLKLKSGANIFDGSENALVSMATKSALQS